MFLIQSKFVVSDVEKIFLLLKKLSINHIVLSYNKPGGELSFSLGEGLVAREGFF